MADDILIEIENLEKDYPIGTQVVHALRGISMTIERGEFIAIMGPSGSGKSTMLNLLGGLDTPSAGSYWLNGRNVSELSADQLAETRNSQIGFVFQGFNLLARTSALANVELPLHYSDRPNNTRRPRAEKMLAVVGLSDRMDHLPQQLSGGQQQRVAIARALVNEPALILADEPTGALDTRTGIEIMGVLQKLNAEGMTIIVVTHEAEIARFARRILRFRDGLLVAQEENPAPALARDLLARLDTHLDTRRDTRRDNEEGGTA